MKRTDKTTTFRSKPDWQLLIGFYKPYLIAGILLVYLTIYYFPLHFLPDIWHVSEIENLRTFIWSLLSITLGFSGMILTLLLLTYNFFVKSTRRNTLEFIVDNPALKVLFSGFVGTLLVQIAAYCMINQINKQDKYAVIYYLLILTVTYLLAQFPIAILGLKHSTSIEKINKMATGIMHKDIDYLINSAAFLEKYPIEKIESNPILLLKDIGLNAIKDGDWILPQKILSNILKLVHQSLDGECPVASTDEAMHIYLWVNKHFQRTAIKNSDHITVNVVAGQILNLYFFLAEKKLHHRQLISQLDDHCKELILLIIQSKDFAEIREFWLRDYTEAMLKCLSSITFTDEQLPTRHYLFTEGTAGHDHPSNKDYHYFWHHLQYTQIANLVSIIKIAIDHKDNRFYDTYHWQVRHLISGVMALVGLTDSQKREYIGEILYRTQDLDGLAIENQIGYKPWVISHLEIEQFARKGWQELYWAAIYHQSSLLRSLIKKGGNYSGLLDEFFMLGRSICNKNSSVGIDIQKEILTYLLDTGLKFYENRGESSKLKYDLQYQLHWLFQEFLQRDEQYDDLTEKFQVTIQLATEGFDIQHPPEF